MKKGTIHDLFSRTACVVSDRHRFIYLTAQNATSSLKAELSNEHCGGVVLARAQVADKLWNQYFTFAFLRDPLTRFLSAYQEVSLHMERDKLEPRPFGRMPDGLDRFQAFLADVEQNGPWNEHIALQLAFVERRRIDFWGLVETLQDDFQQIYTRLGLGTCPVLPKRRSRSGREEKDGISRFAFHPEDLDATTIERIYDLYREDVLLIRAVRPDAPEMQPHSTRAAPPPGMVQVAIALANGGEYSLELPPGQPELGALQAVVSPQQSDGRFLGPQVLQVPLRGGNSALTFSTQHLVRLELRPPDARELRRIEAPATGTGNSGVNLINVGNKRPPTEDPSSNIDEAHLGGYIRAANTPILHSAAGPHGDRGTWNPLLWRWAIEDLDVRSVIDIGCGEGHAAGFFSDGGCEVLALDGSLQARYSSVVPDRHVVHDFVEGPFVPEKSFDMAWTCEFVEHVEARFLHNFLATIASSRKYVMMTFASPTQTGWHHVNCQEQGYWVDQLGRLGFRLDDDLTERGRALAHSHFRERGLVFVRHHRKGESSKSTEPSLRATAESHCLDPLPVQSMQVAQRESDAFYLFVDIFVHPTAPRIVAISPPYGEDWNPNVVGIDYDAVDLVFGDIRVRGRCLRHRLDSWEPCMLLEFEDEDLTERIRANDEINVTIEAGSHSSSFVLTTRPAPAYDVAMSLVVRNENRWIRTFLDYYLDCVKADHVFIYDNGTSEQDQLLSILHPYRERGQVTYIPWDFRWRNRIDRKMIGQPTQEAHSLARFANTGWIGFLDIDEFLRLPHSTLPQFLARFASAEVDGLSFGIRWFSYEGPLALDEITSVPLQFLHSRRNELGRKRQKFFVKGGGSKFLRLHWLEDGGRELPIDDTEIYFHHYDQRPGRFEEGKQIGGARDEYMLRFADQLSRPERHRAPLTERGWITHINSSIERAERDTSKLTPEVLAVDGMCGRYTRHFYNNLCSFGGCRYLEIGSYHGASTCAAIFGNDVSAVCIDNWTQFHGKRSRFEDALRRFRGDRSVRVIEQNCFEVDASSLGPFDIYLYDGDHSQQNQYRALQHFVQTLAKLAVVVIDDWNRRHIRRGTQDAIRDLELDVIFDREILLPTDQTADENRDAGARTWWNGLYIMLVRSRTQ